MPEIITFTASASTNQSDEQGYQEQPYLPAILSTDSHPLPEVRIKKRPDHPTLSICADALLSVGKRRYWQRPFKALNSQGEIQERTGGKIMKEGKDDETQFLQNNGDNGYKPELFVGRENQLKMVAEKVDMGRGKLTIPMPLVNFWGVSGIGKSWLLRHLQHLYAYKSGDPQPTCTIYYDFERQESLELKEFVQHIAASLASQLSSLLTDNQRQELQKAMTSGDSNSLLTVMHSVADECVLLLLLDTTEKLDSESWHGLENDFLEDLLLGDRILVVISGRRHAPRWKRVEVRRRSVSSAKSELKPFDLPTVKKQLQVRQLPHAELLAERIYRYAVGNPKLVTAVYHHFRQLGDKDIGSQWRPDPDEAFTQALSSILQGYQEDILQGITQEQRQYLAALTPLRFYRTQAVAFMLPPRLQQPELVLFRKLQDMAEETDVVWWDDSKNGYVTALVLRQVMNLILYLTDREQYIEQHEQAMKLYWQWANKYPENSAIYLTEICFHQAMLDQIAESPVSSLTDMAKIVEFFTNLEIEIDAKMILPKKLAEDDELARLLTTKAYENLIEQLQIKESQTGGNDG